MSEQDEAADKSFEPTPQKLLEARKKGDIARSAELLTAASYLGFFVSILVWGSWSLKSIGETFTFFIARPDTIELTDFIGNTSLAGGLLSNLGTSLTPLFLVPMLCVLLVLFATRGIVFAGNKVAPKISKISILQNAKQKYGRNGLFQFLLSFIKLIIYSVILFVFIWMRMDEILATIRFDAASVIVLLGRLCIEFFLLVVVISAVIGGVDVVWQHFEHRRKNMMSRKEIMDEVKKNEGDPHLKQERQKRAQTIASSQMASEVAKSDVIIVNPTHYSVALTWDRTPGSAPKCVAKGTDALAASIRQIATENSVPIHSDPPTARAIFATTDVGEQIEPEHYKAVAAAIRFSERMRKKMKDPFA